MSNIGARVNRYLDAALRRGAFKLSGALVGLDADAIADGIAAEFDDRKGGLLCAADLLPYVRRWLTRNDVEG